MQTQPEEEMYDDDERKAMSAWNVRSDDDRQADISYSTSKQPSRRSGTKATLKAVDGVLPYHRKGGDLWPGGGERLRQKHAGQDLFAPVSSYGRQH